MKRLLTICGLALVLAVTFSLAARPVPIEQKLIRVHASDVLADFPGIAQAPVNIQAILLDLPDDPLLQLKTRAAFVRYPDMARSLFRLYGAEPEFHDILRRFGENILPPIHYFVSNRISTIEWMNKAARQYQSARQFLSGAPDDDKPDQPAVLSPQERGWYAVNFIQSEGYNFLGQFIVDNKGDTQWVGTERVLEGLNQFFASGIRDLETNYRSGDEISAGDIGWASVDVLVFASAAKLLRMGRTAAISTKGASRSARSAAFSARVGRSGRMVLSSARYAKWPAVIGAGYLVIAHPSIINDLFAGMAEVLGYPAVVVQIVGWLLLLTPALYLVNWLWWLLAPLVRTVSFMVFRAAGRRRLS